MPVPAAKLTWQQMKQLPPPSCVGCGNRMSAYRIHFEQAVWMCPQDSCQGLATEQVVELQMSSNVPTRCRILQDELASKSRGHKRKASGSSAPTRKRLSSPSVDRSVSGDEVLSTDAPFPMCDPEADGSETPDHTEQSRGTWTEALGDAALEDELSNLLDSIAEDSVDFLLPPTAAS